MPHVLSGGSHTASMVLFDPGSLPADIDNLVKGDLVAAIDAAEEKGLLVVLPEGDSGHLLHLCVHEEIPQYLAGYLNPEFGKTTLLVTSGKLCYCGVEYVHHEDDSLLRKHPAMGEYASVAPGEYKVAVHIASYPKGTVEEELARRVSGAERALLRVEQGLGCLTVIAFVALLGSLIVTWGSRWNYYAMAAAFLTFGALYLLHRLPAYKRVSGEWMAAQKRFPGYVVVMTHRQGGKRKA